MIANISYRFFIAVFITVSCATASIAQTRAVLNVFSHNELTVKRLNCPAGSVQFARGVRWAPVNDAVSLTINDRDELLLPAACYAEMYCARYKGASSVVIVAAPACGGSAVSEEYIVVDLISKQKKTLDYRELKATVR